MDGLMIRTITLRSRYDDLDISVLVVSPEGQTHAVIQLAHGMCGCKERFMPVMEYMAGKGIACVAGDHRGHGASVKSEKDRGYMYDGGFRALVDDMRLITTWAHKEYPEVPLYLLGHSMGSMAARVYVKEDDSQIDGLIICGSPSWNSLTHLGRAITWLLCHVGLSHHHMNWSHRMASKRYNRRFAMEGPLAWTCSDSDVRKSFAENPLCNFTLTANGSNNLMNMMFETYRIGPWSVTKPDMPILFISGEDDPMMLSEDKLHQSAQNICNRGYRNVTSAIYPGMRHEVLNEAGKEEVWNDILDSLNLT